jgi:hypothetical protein
MTRIMQITPAALLLAAGPALAQDDGVAEFGSSGTASLFGVTGSLNETETEGAPDDVATLVTHLQDGALPEIAWQSVSPVTDVTTVPLDRLDGSPDGLDEAIAASQGQVDRIRAGVAGNPTLSAALEEAGYEPGSVIAAYGSSASEIALVIDTRG